MSSFLNVLRDPVPDQGALAALTIERLNGFVGLLVGGCDRHQVNQWEFPSAEQLAEKQAGHPPLEIPERMNRQQPPFGEGEGSEQKIIGQVGATDGKVGNIAVDQHRNLVRRRRLVGAHLHRNRSPPAGPIGHKIARDSGV